MWCPPNDVCISYPQHSHTHSHTHACTYVCSYKDTNIYVNMPTYHESHQNRQIPPAGVGSLDLGHASDFSVKDVHLLHQTGKGCLCGLTNLLKHTFRLQETHKHTQMRTR